ncbi:hypothetical protein LJR143_002215 [Pseudoxanthomonas sp. LjRoot143]|uniref:hypothetical protein n=1 Tax=Pseudoxanthomonas sp. LjRoot143 TaxID=3342266 RepID=UPI003ECE84D7
MPIQTVRRSAPPSVSVHFDGLELRLIEGDSAVERFRLGLYREGVYSALVMAWGPSIRVTRDNISPTLWLGQTFCIDIPEAALQSIESWLAELPPPRAVMRLADQPEALPIENAEAIAAAASIAHGAPCDVRC